MDVLDRAKFERHVESTAQLVLWLTNELDLSPEQVQQHCARLRAMVLIVESIMSDTEQE